MKKFLSLIFVVVTVLFVSMQKLYSMDDYQAWNSTHFWQNATALAKIDGNQMVKKKVVEESVEVIEIEYSMPNPIFSTLDGSSVRLGFCIPFKV